MIWRMAFGKVSQARDIESFRLKELQVRSKTSRLPVALDGEVEFMHPPLHYRTRPGALRVIVPYRNVSRPIRQNNPVQSIRPQNSRQPAFPA